MGSFVPFGGFFSTPSEIASPLGRSNQSLTPCHLCTEKYEQEVAALRKIGSNVSVADQYSEGLPSWLQMTELCTGKGDDTKTRDDGATLDARILGLHKKWSDTCKRVHHNQPVPRLDFLQPRSQIPITESCHLVPDWKEGSSKDSSKEIRSSSLNMESQKVFPPKHNLLALVSSGAENVTYQPKLLVEDPRRRLIELERPNFSSYPLPNGTSSSPNHASCSSSLTSVTTDLGLGTLYASTIQKAITPRLQHYEEQHNKGSISADLDANSENTSHQIAQSSSCSSRSLAEQFNPKDYKSLRSVLARKVDWQEEAICCISQTLSRCRAGYGRHRPKGDIWLTFLGPDRVGKKRIATTIAEMMFGSQENLLPIDLNSEEAVSQTDSVFECEQLNDYDVKLRGKTIVDYIAGELGKRPYSVIFLDNVDKADFLTQSSLSQAIRTGKFPDSHGRQISINNTIFVMASTFTKGTGNSLLKSGPAKFSEERILKAKSWQMKTLVISASENSGTSSGRDISLQLGEETSNLACVNKRKLVDSSGCLEQDTVDIQKRACKTLRSHLDLNLPVKEIEEDINSESISENMEPWLEQFFGEVDEQVAFKPFNFDRLSEKVVKDIDLQFRKIFGSEILLVIDDEVMIQILAAAWLSDTSRAVEDWVEKVVAENFAEAHHKYNPSARSVVKLAVCGGVSVKEHDPRIRLPAKILLN